MTKNNRTRTLAGFRGGDVQGSGREPFASRVSCLVSSCDKRGRETRDTRQEAAGAPLGADEILQNAFPGRTRQ